MSIHFVPPISGGVLLSRLGEVHRDIGGQTVCGLKIPPRRGAVVSHVQAIVFKLALCHVCYPNPPRTPHPCQQKSVGGGARIVIPRSVHDLNDKQFTISEVNGRIRFTHWVDRVPRYMDFDPNTSMSIERAISEARAAALHRFRERHRCKVCGGVDFDRAGHPTVCPGPPKEEPDWEEL